MLRALSAVTIFVAAVSLAACASAPQTVEGQSALTSSANATLEQMINRDASLVPILDQSAGYVVFPEVAKGGALVGGATGEGVVYRNGQVIGYAELNQASIGAQLGGQSFAELVVFQTDDAMQRFRAGNFDLGVEASAIALRSGAGRTAHFEQGVAAFVMPRTGLMAELSISGQQIEYQPRAM